MDRVLSREIKDKLADLFPICCQPMTIRKRLDDGFVRFEASIVFLFFLLKKFRRFEKYDI